MSWIRDGAFALAGTVVGAIVSRKTPSRRRRGVTSLPRPDEDGSVRVDLDAAGEPYRLIINPRSGEFDVIRFTQDGDFVTLGEGLIDLNGVPRLNEQQWFTQSEGLMPGWAFQSKIEALAKRGWR